MRSTNSKNNKKKLNKISRWLTCNPQIVEKIRNKLTYKCIPSEHSGKDC